MGNNDLLSSLTGALGGMLRNTQNGSMGAEGDNYSR